MLTLSRFSLFSQSKPIAFELNAQSSLENLKSVFSKNADSIKQKAYLEKLDQLPPKKSHNCRYLIKPL